MEYMEQQMDQQIEAGIKNMEAMKDGDIFYWRWADDDKHYSTAGCGAYHCYSRIAVCKNGRLYDTFWCSPGDNSRLTLDRIITKYRGNPDEMEKIGSDEIAYYKPDDLVDMNHPNNSRAPIYVKAGCKRDPETMMAFAKYQVERSESEARYAQERIGRLNEAITMIDAGELDSVHIPVVR